MNKMKLFWSPTSPYARKVMVAAHELALADRIEAVHVVTRDEPAELLAINPCGKIPVLVATDGAIPESALICRYLDTVAGGGRLAPSGGAESWRAHARAEQADAMLDSAMLVRAERMRPQIERSAEWEDKQLRKVTRSLDMFEYDASTVAPFGIAEISLACALAYFRLRFETDDFFSTRPRLARWLAEVSARPSMTGTAPPVG